MTIKAQWVARARRPLALAGIAFILLGDYAMAQNLGSTPQFNAAVQGFRLVAYNPNVDVDLYDGSLQEPVNSERSSYIRKAIRERVWRASVVVCLIGNGTAWRDWVVWELRTGVELGKGLCGVRLKESRGRTPPMLAEVGAAIARWSLNQIVAAIECAAARRS